MQFVQRVKGVSGRLNLWRFCGAVVVILFAGCAMGKETVQQDAPFELIWAQAQPWVSGTTDGPSGMRLSFELSPPSSAVHIKSLCYMQQTAPIISRSSKPDEFSASYLSRPNKAELEPQSCTVPALWKKEVNLPDHAVLVYEKEGQDYYFVIQDIVLKPVLAYPGKQ